MPSNCLDWEANSRPKNRLTERLRRRDNKADPFRKAETMSTTLQELEEFTRFARQQLADAPQIATLDALFDAWREQHPSMEDALAIQASLRDLEQGVTGRAFEEFASEKRQLLDRQAGS